MERRHFIVLLGGMAIAGPVPARAQQADRLRRIGVLMGFAEDDEVWRSYLEAFRRRLQDLGWTVGRNLQIDYWVGGHKYQIWAKPDQFFCGESGSLGAITREADIRVETAPGFTILSLDLAGSGWNC